MASSPPGDSSPGRRKSNSGRSSSGDSSPGSFRRRSKSSSKLKTDHPYPVEVNPISEEERQQIAELVKTFSPEWGDKATEDLALRSLRTDDKVKTPEMIMNSVLQWRQQVGADSVLTDAEFAAGAEMRSTEIWPSFVYGKDKFGHIIIAEEAKPLRKNWPAIYAKYDLKDIVRHRCHWYEQISELVAQAAADSNQPIVRILYVLDIGAVGLSDISRANKTVLKAAVLDLAAFYPNICCKVCIVNANSVFTTIWSFCKAILDESSVAKVAVLGKGQRCIKEFQEMGVDLDQLPEFLGGTCKPTRNLNAYNHT